MALVSQCINFRSVHTSATMDYCLKVGGKKESNPFIFKISSLASQDVTGWKLFIKSLNILGGKWVGTLFMDGLNIL